MASELAAEVFELAACCEVELAARVGDTKEELHVIC